MNDPGFDPAIVDTAHEIEDRARGGSENDPDAFVHWAAAERPLDKFLKPVRWWYASTEIPLMAATFGPMANAFSVCSLAERWTLIVNPGEPPYAGQSLPDPPWELAVNAVSLAAALIANLCLLLVMTRRLSFNIALPVVIVGWYIAFVLLAVILIIIAREVHSKQDASQNIQMSEAYYYGALAAGLYFILASLLIITIYGAAKGHYSREFHLSQSQRTLMIQTIGFLVYILAGGAVYSHIEGWTFCNAIWWSDFTVLTIGIGYPAPTTRLGRGLLFPYAFGGIIIVGVVVSSIRTLVLERGTDKMSDRLLEKTRRTFTEALTSPKSNKSNSSFGFFGHIPVFEDDKEMDEKMRAKKEFYLMRKVRRAAAMEHRWLSLFTSGMAVGILWFIGALVFQHAEATQGWTYFEALYYAYVSLLTIGYGDIYDISNWGRAFFVFWSLLAVPTMTIFISNLGDTFIRRFQDFANFLGELTLLPGEMGYRERFRQFFHAELWPFTLQKPGPLSSDNKSSEKGTSRNDDLSSTNKRVEGALEKEQKEKKQTDVTSENIYHHQYLLMRELREMYKWVNVSPPKEFDYDEWAYFLKLLGEEDAVEDFRAVAKRNGQANKHLTKYGKNILKWSWISRRSPLLGDKSEAQWLLEALADKLERELRELSDEYQQRQTKKNDEDRFSNSSEVD